MDGSGGDPARARAANLCLLVGALLLLFTAGSRLVTGGPGGVGYGWATAAAAAALAAFGLGLRLGRDLCAYGASAVLAALIAFWSWGLVRRLDLGRGIWLAICLIALRDVWPGWKEGFPWRRGRRGARPPGEA